MKTSLIIPAYFLNGRFVDMTDRCIESSNNETTETILVDDGSPYQYVKKLPYKSKFIRRKENGGYAAAVNDGLRVASGDILILGNNDLVFHEGWLRGLLAVLEEGFDIATCWTSDQEYKLDGVASLR
jgi:glycosyltransferase involved in cell wall biosynthesis